MKPIIRQAVSDDADKIQKVVFKAMSAYALESGITGPLSALQENKKDFSRYIRQDKVFVALENEEIIASVRVSRENETTAKISRFAVLPEKTNMGIGALLYEKAEAYAWQAGFSDIILYTSLENSRNLHFYLSRGFTVESYSFARAYKRGLLRKKL